jgi:hypothetical protein
MLINPLHLALLAAGATGPADVVITVVMSPGELVLGEEHSFTVDLAFAQGVSASGAGIPAPFLQLEVPEGVHLGGTYVTELARLKSNEFLQEPYERLLKELPATIPFTLTAPPGDDASLGINITGYLHEVEGENTRVRFLRRRLELPLRTGARAVEVSAERSNWGADGDLLQIGDRAPAFNATRPDGSTFDLADVLGLGPVIVTTYRAHW